MATRQWLRNVIMLRGASLEARVNSGNNNRLSARLNHHRQESTPVNHVPDHGHAHGHEQGGVVGDPSDRLTNEMWLLLGLQCVVFLLGVVLIVCCIFMTSRHDAPSLQVLNVKGAGHKENGTESEIMMSHRLSLDLHIHYVTLEAMLVAMLLFPRLKYITNPGKFSRDILSGKARPHNLSVCFVTGLSLLLSMEVVNTMNIEMLVVVVSVMASLLWTADVVKRLLVQSSTHGKRDEGLPDLERQGRSRNDVFVKDGDLEMVHFMLMCIVYGLLAFVWCWVVLVFFFNMQYRSPETLFVALPPLLCVMSFMKVFNTRFLSLTLFGVFDIKRDLYFDLMFVLLFLCVNAFELLNKSPTI